MAAKKTALIMGVANQRSIAWGCAQNFLNEGWNVVATYESERFKSKVEGMISKQEGSVVALQCDVQNDIPIFFSDQLPESIQNNFDLPPKIDAIVHSIGHAPNLKTTPLLETTREDFLEAHDISSYSLLEVARCAKQFEIFRPDSSLTALTYLGAVRAISGYRVMGPAKASLESVVRGLSLELAENKIRINAVSAGPLATIAAKGGIENFDAMRQHVEKCAPLGNVTVDQVASTVHFLASKGHGITGQTIYVDGGYNTVAGPPLRE